METIRVGVVGATGKMGREILKAVTNDPATEVIFGVGLVDEPTTITVEGREIPVTADLDAALSANDVDVVIDFTNADAFRQNEVYLVRIEGQQPRIQLVGQGYLIAPPSPYVHIVFWEMSAHFLAD